VREEKGRTYNQYKPTTLVFICDTINEGNKANIQLKIYTKKETLGSVTISNKEIELKKPLNNKLFSERKPYIHLNAKLKDKATYISYWLRGS
jgi:hypothetical protein